MNNEILDYDENYNEEEMEIYDHGKHDGFIDGVIYLISFVITTFLVFGLIKYALLNLL